jgi:hypothetical protein
MVKKFYKLALQHILVNIRLCPNLMCIWVQKMLWGTEISKNDMSYMKLCERSIQLWTMYTHTLLKLSNFFYTNLMDRNMVPHEFVNRLTKFGYYYNYYVVIWRNKFELFLEDIWIFHLYPGYEL